MAEPGEVMRLDQAIVLRGPVLTELAWVLGIGMREMQRRDGITPPASLIDLRQALRRAAAEVIAPVGNAAMPEDADRESWETQDLIGTAEAAQILGLQPRQVRNLAARLGGRKTGGVLLLEREAVQAEAERRPTEDE